MGLDQDARCDEVVFAVDPADCPAAVVRHRCCNVAVLASTTGDDSGHAIHPGSSSAGSTRPQDLEQRSRRQLKAAATPSCSRRVGSADTRVVSRTRVQLSAWPVRRRRVPAWRGLSRGVAPDPYLLVIAACREVTGVLEFFELQPRTALCFDGHPIRPTARWSSSGGGWLVATSVSGSPAAAIGGVASTAIRASTTDRNLRAPLGIRVVSGSARSAVESMRYDDYRRDRIEEATADPNLIDRGLPNSDDWW